MRVREMTEWTDDALHVLKTACGCFEGFSTEEAAWQARAAMVRKHGNISTDARDCREKAKTMGLWKEGRQ